MSIAIVLSIAAHAAALAVVKIEIPTVSPSAAGLSVIATAPAPTPVEPPIQVIEIRPPGMVLPAGGAAPAAPANASIRSSTIPSASPIRGPGATIDRPRAAIQLAPRAPEAEFARIVVASTAGPDDGGDLGSTFTPDPRPGRGVVLKQGGVDWAAGGSGVGTTGRGRGVSTGGLTVTGTGGDCITPGLARPDDSALTNRKDGGRTGLGRLRDAILGGRGGIRPGG